jgi:hypothetical protein
MTLKLTKPGQAVLIFHVLSLTVPVAGRESNLAPADNRQTAIFVADCTP